MEGSFLKGHAVRVLIAILFGEFIVGKGGQRRVILPVERPCAFGSVCFDITRPAIGAFAMNETVAFGMTSWM